MDIQKIKIMGLIREPKNVDFYVLDKPWTDKERKEFSEFIRLRKEKQKKRSIQAALPKRRTITKGRRKAIA